jgi:membrane protease YdiL (CAAX protease family)
MTSLSPASPRSFVALTDFRFRLWPILFAAILMEGLLELGRLPARALYRAGESLWADHVSVFLLMAIAFQALLGLVAVLVMRRLLPAADDHLRWPSGRSYVGLAVLLGIGMGLVMLVADYWPVLAAQTPPDLSYSKYPIDSAGYLLGMITTGLAEETIFRGLLVGMLVVLVPGRLRIGSLDLPVAAYIVALLFGLAHWKSFTLDPFYQAMAQQIYAFAWGLLYVWLMERSRSLLAPMVAHGFGNFTEVGIVIALNALWS